MRDAYAEGGRRAPLPNIRYFEILTLYRAGGVNFAFSIHPSDKTAI
jgi:hypothetical protein